MGHVAVVGYVGAEAATTITAYHAGATVIGLALLFDS